MHEQEIVLVVLLVLGVPLALLIWLIVTAVGAKRGVRRLEDRVAILADQLAATRHELRDRLAAAPVAPPAPATPAPIPAPVITHQPSPIPPSPAPPPITHHPSPIPSSALSAVPPPLPPRAVPPITHQSAPLPPPRPPPPPKPAINWEQFLGAKLYGWAAGFVLFLALIFFLKLAFEKQWISPELQVALEYVIGVGLLVGGLWLQRRNYPIIAQTLCATAVLALYAVTFAARGYYHLLGFLPCFLVMAVVTTAAFFLAVRLNAQVVAVLGLVGGFLTPVLLSTGVDNPLGLFGYIAFLDIGLIAVTERKRWQYLILLAAIGTVLLQWGWVSEFYKVEKVYTAMAVFLGFEALFVAAFGRGPRDDLFLTISAIALAFMPLAFALNLLDSPSLGARPGLLFSFVLAADLGILLLVFWRTALAAAHLVAGGAAFLLLAIWMGKYVSTDLLEWGLGLCFVFALLHTVYPLVLERLRPGTAPGGWSHLFPPLALGLVMIPILRLPELSWFVWVVVLGIDAIVFGVAVLTASVLAILGALVLTLAAAAIWILRAPALATGLSSLLVVVGGFALVFFVGGVLLAKKFARPAAAAGPGPGRGAAASDGWGFSLSTDARAHVPAFAAILPFVLLILMVLRLPLADPSPVFGLALALVVLLLGVAKWSGVDLLVLLGLICSVALQFAWHGPGFRPELAVTPLVWHLVFVVVFAVFPFLFRRDFAAKPLAWAAAALSGPVYFPLVYRVVKLAWPNDVMGLLPAAFAVPPLLSLIIVAAKPKPHGGASAACPEPVERVPSRPADPRVGTRDATPAGDGQGRRLANLAWFGGATLFFVTLIFPIQFDRQWLTVAWALEGAALCWLFHRVPHPGLRLVGVGLLVIAFVRLGLNPAVLEYHARSATPLLNWYLYAYGLATVSLFAGARLLAPPRDRVGAVNAPALLATLGTVLAFLLLNIEIADYFTEPGARTLTFQFSGNFARDMTYSIAWAGFALALLVAGIVKKLRAPRYASLALLGVTLLKLFFHDLSRLNQLYRIGAFVGVAVILFVASFLYQRFVTPNTKGP